MTLPPLELGNTISKKIESHVFHIFKNHRLLGQAFTHPSAVSGKLHSNQRLEFLGDRVLGMVVADLLYEKYPNENEGALAARFAALVRRDALVRIAQKLSLGDHIIVAKGEEDNGGRQNSANLADLCEALIAALFLDGGYEVAARFIIFYWTPLMLENQEPPRDSKSALQEWSQKYHGRLPIYTLISCDGPPHSPCFKIQVKVSDFPSAFGEGQSKQSAEQLAAQTFLDFFVLDDDRKTK